MFTDLINFPDTTINDIEELLEKYNLQLEKDELSKIHKNELHKVFSAIHVILEVCDNKLETEEFYTKMIADLIEKNKEDYVQKKIITKKINWKIDEKLQKLQKLQKITAIMREKTPEQIMEIKTKLSTFLNQLLELKENPIFIKWQIKSLKEHKKYNNESIESNKDRLERVEIDEEKMTRYEEVDEDFYNEVHEDLKHQIKRTQRKLNVLSYLTDDLLELYEEKFKTISNKI